MKDEDKIGSVVVEEIWAVQHEQKPFKVILEAIDVILYAPTVLSELRKG